MRRNRAINRTATFMNNNYGEFIGDDLGGRKMLLIGAHMSISGGLYKAIEHGESIECTAIQIFTKNANQWKAKPITIDEIDLFKKKWEESNIASIFGHNAYLINLCATDKSIYEKSMSAMLQEIERTEQLVLPYLVFHPGSHGGAGYEAGIKKIAESLNLLIRETKNYKMKLLLETVAGQGTNVGYTFEQLAEIIKLVKDKKRIGVCYDTCHTFSAGYDIRTKKVYGETFKTFDKIIGLENLFAFHINDSKYDLGARKDRHEHIGKGFIGVEAFKFLLNDKRFEKVPKVLETPKGPDMKEDIENLKILKALVN